MHMIRIYNQGNIAALGCGYRSVLVKEGRKKVKLFDWTTCEIAQVDKRIFEKMKKEELSYNMRKVAKVIRERVRAGYCVKTLFVKEVLQSLKGSAE